MATQRRTHGATCIAEVTLAAVKGDKTLAELATQFQVHQSQVLAWKQRLIGRADELFVRGGQAEPEADVKALHAKIGQLAKENDSWPAHSGV
jgi:transposase-like protein